MTNLDDLMKKVATPEITPTSGVSTEVDLDLQGEVVEFKKEEALPRFTPEEESKIEDLVGKIDVTNSALSTTYGAGAQQNIAKFSDRILQDVQVKDSGDVGALINGLVLDLKGSSFLGENNGIMGRIPFFNKAKRKIDEMIAQYETISQRIETVSTQLKVSQQTMLKDDITLRALQEENVKYFNQLKLYVEAGQRFLKKAHEEIIPQLQAEAEQRNDQMAYEVVKQYIDSVDRFEKRIADLRISQTIATQTAPQIQIIRNNGQMLVDKIDSINSLTIPLWKSQMVIALGIANQSKTVQVVRNVSDATNDMLLKNAENLHRSSVEIAQESERSVVDVETVEKVNQELIATLQETTEIQRQGRAKRQEAEVKLREIEANLGNQLRAAIDARQNDYKALGK